MESYSQLKTDIKSWLVRDDLLDSELDNFIAIATARINRKLRIAGMETEADLTLDARVVDLPTDFRGMRAIRIDATSRTVELRYVAPEQLDSMDLTGTGQPAFFTIRGTKLVLNKTPDTTYTAKIHYYQKFSNLSDSVTTNWLTDNAPDVMLYGCLCAAGKYIRDPEVMQTYQAYFDQAIQEASEADGMDKYGPAPVMRTEGWTP